MCGYQSSFAQGWIDRRQNNTCSLFRLRWIRRGWEESALITQTWDHCRNFRRKVWFFMSFHCDTTTLENHKNNYNFVNPNTSNHSSLDWWLVIRVICSATLQTAKNSLGKLLLRLEFEIMDVEKEKVEKEKG